MKPLSAPIHEVASGQGHPIQRTKVVPLASRLFLYTYGGLRQASIRTFAEENDLQSSFAVAPWRRLTKNSGSLYYDAKVFGFGQVSKDKAAVKSVKLDDSEKRFIDKTLEWPELKNFLRECSKHYYAYDVPTLQKIFGSALTDKDVVAYIRFQARTKASFLESYGVSQSQVRDTMSHAALLAMMVRYPRIEDEGHLRAVCKTAAHNCLINLIMSYTTDKRQSLAQSSDGTYSAKLTSISSDPGIIDRHLSVDLKGSIGGDWELRFALEQLKTSPKLSARQRRFLCLMSGDPDAEFSEWLGRKDSDDVLSMPYESFLRLVCRFLSVSEEKATALLRNLKSLL